MPRLPRPRRLTLALCLGVAATAGPAAPAHAVIGGAPTAAGAAPWMVALIDADTGKKTVAAGQFCGATVIAPNLLLTAAHCVSDDDGYKTSASDIKVFTGLVLPLRKGPLLSVKSVAVFPHYSDGAGQTDGDVGLIEMERPFTDRTPLPFARPQDGATIGAGASLHIWGWGNRATGEYENYPRQLEDGPVTRYADATCDDDYGRYFNPAAQLCAGQPDGHVDACQGDSGGPITGTGADGTTVLVGSVSFGEGCGVPGFPTVYTKSYRYRTFIAKGLKAAAADLTAGAGKGRHTAGRHAKRRHAHARHGRRAKAHRHG